MVGLGVDHRSTDGDRTFVMDAYVGAFDAFDSSV